MSHIIISAVFSPEPIVSANLTSDIAIELASIYHVTVLSPSPSRPFGFKFEKSTKINNYKHIVTDSYVCPKSKVLGRFRESYSFGKHCHQYISRDHSNIDVIYANTWPLIAHFLTVNAAKKYNIPIIIHVQDVYPESLANKLPVIGKMLNWLLLPIDKYTLCNASKVIAISDKMKSYLVKTRKLDNEKVQVISNWQNEEEFIRFSQSKQGDNLKNDFTFMYLGNIGPVAGIDLLIDGFVKANLTDCRLVIAGSGSQKETLQKKCTEQQLTHIEFWDVPDGKVPEIQDQADVMFLPIKKGAASSSIPSKLPAYMFSAKPIISCVDENSDTANAIREANCGWVLSPEDVNSLTQQMKEVVSLPKEILSQKGKSGFDYAIQNFSKKNNLQKIVNIITETCKK
jgi:glycosyltransferase involved in cell wall biosynthesis